jgi:hypothetical protein
MSLVALSTKAIASLSSLEPPAGHRLSGLIAGEDIFAGAACRIDDDGMVYLSSANAANANADVHGWAWRTVKQGGAITLGFHERMMYGDSLTPGAPLYLSADNTKKGRLDTAPGTGSPLPCAFVMEDGQRIYCLQNVGASAAVFSNAEATTFFANVPQANEPLLGTTTNLTAVPGSFADLAAVQAYLVTLRADTEARLDAIEAKVDAVITKLIAAKIIAP